METVPRRSRSVFRLLSTLLLIALCAALVGCGDSDSSGEAAESSGPTAAEQREAKETQQVKQELKEGNFVDCGSQVFVNKKIFCGFAKNMRHAYYAEVVGGPGKVVGLHPPDGKDYRVYCSGTVPHRCTGFKDDGRGIEPLQGALIFFSP